MDDAFRTKLNRLNTSPSVPKAQGEIQIDHAFIDLCIQETSRNLNRELSINKHTKIHTNSDKFNFRGIPNTPVSSPTKLQETPKTGDQAWIDFLALLPSSKVDPRLLPDLRSLLHGHNLLLPRFLLYPRLGGGDDLGEPGMFGVLLVVVARLLGLEVFGELLEDDGEDAVDGSLVVAVAVPDADEVARETGGEGQAADVVGFEVRLAKGNKGDE